MSLFELAGEPEPVTVMAATKWTDNSEMVLDLRRLGHIKDTDRIYDPTYQDGTWWKRWRPEGLITASLDPANGPDIIADFRHAPFADESFDVVAYDPPYVVKGGRDTSTMQDHQRRYGIDTAPKKPVELQALIDHGMMEMARISSWIVLAKCQDYVSSQKVWWGTDLTRRHAEEHCGLRAIDKLYFLNNGSAQDPDRDKKCPACKGKGGNYKLADPINCPQCDGSGRVPSVQEHARQNVSVCWVFEKVHSEIGEGAT